MPIKPVSDNTVVEGDTVTRTRTYDTTTFESGENWYLGQGPPSGSTSGYFGRAIVNSTETIQRDDNGNFDTSKTEKTVTVTPINLDERLPTDYPIANTSANTSTKPLSEYIYNPSSK
ncbi:hypothetical protein RclHR1_02680010 [Rhizophagus clarus]|uniref:Uncharacterized protein n=1 Tax=Rhizophagus clarus TaxID=94130 RepID=A0A2Z6RVM1_9GLOM|nr:hypothetical protein RclHR1_02680010 [Rhizophagus clarus]